MSSDPPIPDACGTTVRSMRFAVDAPRLLSTVVPKLVASPVDSLAEIVQNASRAGATTLVVRLDSQVIEFTDDGPGVDDPVNLFNLARSGWAPDVATDPAGMGAFTFFALTTTVRITSIPRDPNALAWTADFTTANVVATDVPFPVRYEPAAGRPSGLTIQATLRADIALPDLTSSWWRHQYPVRVLVSVNGAPVVEVPPVATDGLSVPTPVGRVQVEHESTVLHRSCAIWEHRLVEQGDAVRQRVLAATSASLAGEVVRYLLRSACITWHVAPDCGVAPTLPTRNELLHNQALTDAVHMIATTLEAEVDSAALRSAALAAAGGPIVETSLQRGLPSALAGQLAAAAGVSSIPVDLVLPHLGYVCADRADALHTVEYCVRDDGNDTLGLDHEPMSTNVWVQPCYRARTDAVAQLALAADIPATTTADPALPELALACETMAVSPALGAIFCDDLHLVSTTGSTHGRRVARVATLYSATDENGEVDLRNSFAEDDRARLETHEAACRAISDEYDAPFTCICPLAPGEQALDYILTSRDFLHHSIFLTACVERPLHLWDHVDYVEKTVDTEALLRAIADVVADEQGPEVARRVRQESEAIRLSAALRATVYEARRRILRGVERDLASRRALGLVPAVLDRIEAAIATFEGLAELTPEQLLGRAGQPPA